MTFSSTALLEVVRTSLLPPQAVSKTREHMLAALDWIHTAQQVTSDGGISKGYDVLRARWGPSYPETTGYTIPTLLNVASLLHEARWHDMALSLADYLVEQVSARGGAVHWEQNATPPVVFDTGQVLFGLVAAYRASQKSRYLETAQRAATFLVESQDASGAWLRNQHLGVPKTIDTRVAWALLEMDALTPEKRYREAAIRNLEWALQQQHPDGWFSQCAFRPQEAPYTHTLAYTAEGLMACGLLLNERRYIHAARRTALALLYRQREDGSLGSAWWENWRPAATSSCLTGNCQMAILWIWFYQREGHPGWLDAAQRSVRFVAGTQLRGHHLPAGIRGGIAGSSPIWGRYERLKYPNWAAKFFLDALLWLESTTQARPLVHYAG